MMLAGTNRPPARPMLSRRDRDGGGDMRGAIVDARLGVAISRPARKGHASACMVRGLRRIARSLPVDGGVPACAPAALADIALARTRAWQLVSENVGC
jgi:hypothetical protein